MDTKNILKKPLVKMYKFWLGQNRFLCGGYIITGFNPSFFIVVMILFLTSYICHLLLIYPYLLSDGINSMDQVILSNIFFVSLLFIMIKASWTGKYYNNIYTCI